MTDARPDVAVVVPFHGDAEDARALDSALRGLDLRSADEVIVADNTRDPVYAGAVGPEGRATVVHAHLERSSYYARNVGAEKARAPWLLFIDSDCRPPSGLVDSYFDGSPVADDVGILAGAVSALDEQTELSARYAASRGHIDPSAYEREHRRPAGITANLLVRRTAWEQVAGFQEGIKSGADLEFCWRVQDAGWRFERRVQAVLAHEHVRSVAALRRKTIRHAGGGGWVNQRYPGAFHRPTLGRGLARAIVGVGVWALLLQPTRSVFKGMDGLFLMWDAWGRTSGNRADRDVEEPMGELGVAGVWPARGVDSSVAPRHVEALRRPVVPDREVRRRHVVTYAEDDGLRARLAATARLIVRRPTWIAGSLRELGLRDTLTLAPTAVRIHRAGVQVRALDQHPHTRRASALGRRAPAS